MPLTARLYQVLVALVGLGFLVYATLQAPPMTNVIVLGAFVLLSTFVKRAGFRVVPEATHSLVGIVDLAALLIFGPLAGAWVAAPSEAAYLVAHAVRRYPFHPLTHVGTPL